MTRVSEGTVHGGRDACGWGALPVAAEFEAAAGELYMRQEHEARDPHILRIRKQSV